ncbi:ribosome small subunit-dependent GTPase A [uncultured Traorella sp.]|uniref:ribosome small subunit-dependent GTPase A n=1 Tax=uncultured Traorella sp. TaxID=1929048 RepID=UPI0025FB18C1|nr:ribosome small subunit-dependent GTPase A [uncultured Traorella sp.]
MNKGTIIKNISNQYEVLFDNGEIHPCVAMGKVRLDKKPLVGDHVMVEAFESQYGIQKILDRKNYLARPAIANVDQALIVMSSFEPDFSTTLVDRLIFLISLADIEPVLCVTKMDLVKDEDEIYSYIEDYRKSGYRVYTTGKDFDETEIIECFENKITVLTGQSGAGKSSLLNRINPEFQLQTQKTSKALGRGKHTTRHCELYAIGSGWVADTPGFSSLDFSRVDLLELKDKILDFQIDEECRFRNCVHLDEPDCAVKKAVQEGRISSIRYQNYKDVAMLIKQGKRSY